MRRNMDWWKLVAVALLLAGCIACIGDNIWKNQESTSTMQEEIAKKILRFHVIANSDSEEDQAVKLRVRDAVGAYIEPLLTGEMTLEESETIVEAHLEGIEEIAEQTLAEEGFYYGATACVEQVEFPQKTYGAYTFPEGRYTALDVKLGAAQGHNWWCVLYPNMCFRGSIYEVQNEQNGELLRQVLTQEEYEEVLNSGNCEIRWKLLENIQDRLVGKSGAHGEMR